MQQAKSVTTRSALLIVGVLLLTVLHFSSTAIAKQTAVPKRLIVGFQDSVKPSEQRAIIAAVGGEVYDRHGQIDAITVRVKDGVSTSKLSDRLKQSEAVKYVEKDYVLESTRTPNDPFFSEQFSLLPDVSSNIKATGAWDSQVKCSTIAILDTGIDRKHPDLKNAVWRNKKEKLNRKDDDHNGIIDDIYGANVRKGYGSATDDNGHGTHISGIAAATGNNDEGVAGICWEGKIMAVKFLNSRGHGGTTGAVAAIEYAVNKGAKIINASFGADQPSSALEDALKYARKKDVLVVVAAGNEGRDLEQTPSYPASYTLSNLLTVAASNGADQLTSFSNYGSKSVDLAAPGEDIASTFLNDNYAFQSGTSMSAPAVSATAALLLKKNKNLSPKKLRKIIMNSTDKIEILNGAVASGGRLNVQAALAAG